MNNQNDLAWVALQTNKTEFLEGVHTFNGCTIKISKRQDPYRYTTRNKKVATMSARYWGTIVFPNGSELTFENARGGEIARSTGFSITEEKVLHKKQSDQYLLPYQRQ